MSHLSSPAVRMLIAVSAISIYTGASLAETLQVIDGDTIGRGHVEATRDRRARSRADVQRRFGRYWRYGDEATRHLEGLIGTHIWQAATQSPWDYRAAKWEVAVQEAPDGCPIKGNISENGHVYHALWSPWYAKTRHILNHHIDPALTFTKQDLLSHPDLINGLKILADRGLRFDLQIYPHQMAQVT